MEYNEKQTENLTNGLEKSEKEMNIFDFKKKKLPIVLLAGVFLVTTIVYVLASGTFQSKINAEISIEPEMDEYGLIYFALETNLPDGTLAIVSVKGNGQSEEDGFNMHYAADSEVTILDGNAQSEGFSNMGAPLPVGNYRVEVIVPNVSEQPNNVKKIMGKHMKNITGELVVKDEGDTYLYSEDTFGMPNMADDLTTEEEKIYNGALAWIVFQRMASVKTGQDIITKSFSFNEACYDDSLGLACISYETTMENFDIGSTSNSSESDSLMVLENSSSSKTPFGTIFNEYQMKKTPSLATICKSVQLLADHIYTDEELNNVNLALSQITHWCSIEKDGFDEIILYS